MKINSRNVDIFIGLAPTGTSCCCACWQDCSVMALRGRGSVGLRMMVPDSNVHRQGSVISPSIVFGHRGQDQHISNCEHFTRTPDYGHYLCPGAITLPLQTHTEKFCVTGTTSFTTRCQWSQVLCTSVAMVTMVSAGLFLSSPKPVNESVQTTGS